MQNSLTDEEPVVLFYALEVLQYLVVNEELEFDLVTRVLEKRLKIDISDVNTVIDLDPLALEGLVALLGQGGLLEDESDDESSGNDGGQEASPQSIKAVCLLVDLALSPKLSIKEGTSNFRIQEKIYLSLAGYSATLLGLDSEAIRSWDGIDNSKEVGSDVQRFIHLKEIIMNGMNFTKSNNVDKTEEDSVPISESAAKIGRTILLFEEDVHGSFLFKGSTPSNSDKSTSERKNIKQTRVSKSTLSALPAATSIQERYEADPKSSTATAVLYSIDLPDNSHPETEDILARISECLGDVVNEPLTEPVFQSIQVCSLMHSMHIVWKTIQAADDSLREELLGLVVSQLEEWSETYGEYAYVASAAFLLSVDDSALCNMGVTNIQTTILEGQDNHLFNSEDTQALCLCLVAARLCPNIDSRVEGLIDTIEQSILEGNRCFGSIFGLGIIMSNLAPSPMDGNTDSSDEWRREQARRIMSVLLSEFNSCLAEECDEISTMITSLGDSDEPLSTLIASLNSLNVKDSSMLNMKAVLIALGHSFPVMKLISKDLSKCILLIVEQLPWGSGKGLVLHVAYKNGLESGVLTQEDLSEAILTISRYVQESNNGVGDALLSLALLHRLSSDKGAQTHPITKCQELVKDSYVSGDDKLMSILAACSVIGELPGLTALMTPSIQSTVKKNSVADVVELLEGITANDSEKPKVRGASAIGLGVLCAMRSQGNQQKRATAGTTIKILAKDGSLMKSILQEVETTHSLLSSQPNTAVNIDKLCCLFSALDPIAMPGSFSKVIELALNDSSDEKLKQSSVNLLASQLESRRRIGFDGRGFIDLYTRLAKLPAQEFEARIGQNASPVFMLSISNLIYQLPTTVAEEVTTKYLWAICKDTSSYQSMKEFLVGIQNILASMNDSGKEKTALTSSKKTISPALLRSIQKFISSQVFSDLCKCPPNLSTNGVWESYLQCLGLIPKSIVIETNSLDCDITISNAFGLSVCTQSPKSTLKMESWLARHGIEDESKATLRVLMLSILFTSMQTRDEHEMMNSILSILDVMLVKGVDTMALHLMAAKIAFYFDSREVYHRQYLDLPSYRVTYMSSFVVGGKLTFDANNLTTEFLIKLFDELIDDLPVKLAVLCNIWKVSDDVANRASRIIGSASLAHQGSLREIIRTIKGGDC